MSVVFHVKLLSILGFVHLPEKALDKYILCILKLKEFWALLYVVWVFGGGTFVRFLNFSIQ
jgi:hypothetical protein